jgi:hypothetical protein
MRDPVQVAQRERADTGLTDPMQPYALRQSGTLIQPRTRLGDRLLI